jgi:hypothetical protein
VPHDVFFWETPGNITAKIGPFSGVEKRNARDELLYLINVCGTGHYIISFEAAEAMNT